MTRCDVGADRERGAAMVEFALVLPLLLLLVCGIIEFGRAYSLQAQMTGGVREGARVLALGGTAAMAQQAFDDAIDPDLNAALGSITASPCPGGDPNVDATVSITYTAPVLTPVGYIMSAFFDQADPFPADTFPLNATGVMRCMV